MGSSVIRDARHIYRARDAVELAARRTRFLAEAGVDVTEDDRPLDAYVNEGRWVADCAECNGGIGVWPDENHGTCLDCGHRFTVKFPTRKQREDAEAVLLERPHDKNRNWRPGAEPVAELRNENKRHLKGGG